MHILPLVSARTGRRPGIPALVAVCLLVSLLALPAAAATATAAAGASAHASLLPPTLRVARRG